MLKLALFSIATTSAILAQGCLMPGQKSSSATAPAASSGSSSGSGTTSGGGSGSGSSSSVTLATGLPMISFGALTTVRAGVSGVALPYPQFATVAGMQTNIVPALTDVTITNCTISPSLPAGLSISTTNCSITGTPTAASTSNLYLVTATSGSKGSGTALLALSVSPSGTPMVATELSSYVLPVGQSTSIPTFLGGGATSSYCSTTPPTGFTASGCAISGTAAGAFNSAPYLDGAIGPTAAVFPGFEVLPYWYSYQSGSWGMTGFPATAGYLGLTAVVTASAPLVTYDGTQAHLQQTLAVGKAVVTVTPVNAGASITSCSASPTLPAGLTLSQSDCSISGTPTTASAATVYTLTPAHNSNHGNTLALTLAVQPATVNAMACQSGTLCVHNLMPLWDQSDPALTTYVNAQTGLNLSGDPGWCGAVSGAMVIDSYIQEIQTYTGLQSTATPAPYSSGMTEYPFIYKTMQQLGTNIAAGGTSSAPNAGFTSLVGQCMQTDDFFDLDWSFPYLILPFNQTTGYRQAMPIGWLNICQYGDIGNCHALAVNGAEGSYFKIYDPWGTVYDAAISVSFPSATGNEGDHGTIQFQTGNTENFNSAESGGDAMLFASNWIYGHVYTQNGPSAMGQCAEP